MKQSQLKQLIKEQILVEIESVSGTKHNNIDNKLYKELIELSYNHIHKLIQNYTSFDITNFTDDPDFYKVSDAILEFIKNQMIFNNYEILRKNHEILVTFSNKNLVNIKDAIEYIDEHPKVKHFLESIIWSFYLETIESDISKLKGEIKQYIGSNIIKWQDEYTNAGGVIFRYFIKDEIEYRLAEFMEPDDVFYDLNFKYYLQNKLLKADLIK